MKHKIGEKTSHSYLSWTHGPRRTTHGTSEQRPWQWRNSRRSILPLARCREEVSSRSPYWNLFGGGTMEKFVIPESLRGFPHGSLHIGQRRAPEEVGPTQETSWRGLGPSRASTPPGRPLAPLSSSFGDLEAYVSLIFFIVFWIFSGFGKLGKIPCKKDISNGNWHWVH